MKINIINQKDQATEWATDCILAAHQARAACEDPNSIMRYQSTRGDITLHRYIISTQRYTS